MRFYDNLLKNVDIAILEGIVTFGNNEGRFCRELSVHYKKFEESKHVYEQNEIISQYLKAFVNFATVFKIIRNIGSNTENRYKLLNLIFNEFLPAIDKEYSPSSIDIYSDKANQLGLTRGKLTSAFSKIAFLHRPNLYFPFDKTARESLEKFLMEKGLRINLDRNYLSYSNVVDKAFNEFDQCHNVKDLIISKQFFAKFKFNKDLLTKNLNNFQDTCNQLNITDIANFIYRRAFDKSLMIYGGFNKSNLVVFTDGIIKEI